MERSTTCTAVELPTRWFNPERCGHPGRRYTSDWEGPGMAKTGFDNELFDRLRAGGLRKRVASTVAEAVGAARNGKPPKQVDRIVAELRTLAAELEDRAKGGPAK